MASIEPSSTVRLGLRKDTEKANVVEGMGAISRRWTRTFTEDQVATESGTHSTMVYKSRTPSPNESREQRRNHKFSSSCVLPVETGNDIYGSSPSSQDDMGQQVIKSLQQGAQVSATSKEDGRPFNFGVVSPGKIYRSRMPMRDDFRYLETLGLKTILSLVPLDLNSDFQDFMQSNSIRHRVVDMPGTKKPITESLMATIMSIVLDKENYPMLIHCNHGKHRTGCAVAVVRHVIGWRIESIIEEYRGFAEPKVRECDLEYITNYRVSSLAGLLDKNGSSTKSTALRSEKMARMWMVTVLVLAIWVATLLYW